MPDDRFVDLNGNEITAGEWAVLFEDFPNRVMVSDTLPDDRILKTIWHGTDFPSAGTRAFGTGLYTAQDTFLTEVGQYDDKDIALRCHAIHVQQLSHGINEQRPHSEDPEAAP